MHNANILVGHAMSDLAVGLKRAYMLCDMYVASGTLSRTYLKNI